MKKKTVLITSMWSKRNDVNADPFEYAVQVKDSGDTFVQLEQAFIDTNRDERPYGLHVPSTTIGDIMALDGKNYLVSLVGFTEITEEEARQYRQAKLATDTVMIAWEKDKHLAKK